MARGWESKAIADQIELMRLLALEQPQIVPWARRLLIDGVVTGRA